MEETSPGSRVVPAQISVSFPSLLSPNQCEARVRRPEPQKGRCSKHEKTGCGRRSFGSIVRSMARQWAHGPPIWPPAEPRVPLHGHDGSSVCLGSRTGTASCSHLTWRQHSKTQATGMAVGGTPKLSHLGSGTCRASGFIWGNGLWLAKQGGGAHIYTHTPIWPLSPGRQCTRNAGSIRGVQRLGCTGSHTHSCSEPRPRSPGWSWGQLVSQLRMM